VACRIPVNDLQHRIHGPLISLPAGPFPQSGLDVCAGGYTVTCHGVIVAFWFLNMFKIVFLARVLIQERDYSIS
jgi:hypothetical protein